MLSCAEEPLYLNDTSWFKLIIEVVLNEKKNQNKTGAGQGTREGVGVEWGGG